MVSKQGALRLVPELRRAAGASGGDSNLRGRPNRCGAGEGPGEISQVYMVLGGSLPTNRLGG